MSGQHALTADYDGDSPVRASIQDRHDVHHRGIRSRWRQTLPIVLAILGVLAVAAFLRFWQLDRIGFNSDEAVYAGTAASIAGDPVLSAIFPIFRAHPVLFQMLLSLLMGDGVDDWAARALSAVIGVLTVLVAYLLGRRLYGHSAGLVAALVLAGMTYHVIVTRQVLLDGLMTLCATTVLYCVVRYSEATHLRWLLAAGAMMGATILAKETSVVLTGGLYAFFALTPAVRLKFRHLLFGSLTAVAVVLAFPLAMAFSGHVSSGQSYLLWQLFRRSNHPYHFYLAEVPAAIGFLVLATAIAGLFWLRSENTWRERLLICWMIVPVAFFTIWPVKGYQYLLPIAPVFAVLAGRTVSRLTTIDYFMTRVALGKAVRLAAAAVLALSVIVPTWIKINETPAAPILAGTGGIPGGREAGQWLKDNVPEGAEVLTIGPSMANILKFYGSHQVAALSVSPNLLSRNPSYVPVENPDYAVRSGRFELLVWDANTAARTPFFAEQLNELVTRYDGVQVYPATTAGPSSPGPDGPPVIIYQVRAE
jgi:Dolichyl-phosphate-mannose-protein mannosyltransferase